MNICSQPEQNKIETFSGAFHFLSNFHPARLMFGGVTYWTAEHAYQAQKTVNDNTRLNISILQTPGEAKQYGKSVVLRSDWDEIKLEIMEAVVRAKFTQNPPLKEKLLATEDVELEEGNTWGDTYWGVCDSEGENHLGKILMDLRKDLNTITLTEESK